MPMTLDIVRTALRDRIEVSQADPGGYRYTDADKHLDQAALRFLQALAAYTLVISLSDRLRRYAADGEYRFSDQDIREDRKIMLCLEHLSNRPEL